MRRGVRRSLGLLAAGTIMAGTASHAFAQTPPGAVVQPLPRDNGAELRGYLTTLANNPQSLDALIGAGRAALRMGDADAALTFFGRADEVSPRNPRVKAGMAATLVQLGQAEAALSMFGDAVALGAPEAEIQADRGLAYDMSGDPRRAQQDYVAALRRRDDEELRRRLALSLAISGHRDAALRTIDAQLRRNERGAWRTQAFILALTGDAAGATRTAQSQMPGGGQQMAPFFARLQTLSPAQKAMAVHLGRFPSNGSAQAQTRTVDIAPDPTALAFAGVTTRTHTPAASASRTRQQGEDRRGSRTGRRGQADPSDRFGLRARIERQGSVAPPVERPEVAQVETRWAGSPYQSSTGGATPTPSEPQASSAAAPASPDMRASLPSPSAVQPPVAVARATTAPTSPQSQAPTVTAVPIPASVPELNSASAAASQGSAADLAPAERVQTAPAETAPASGNGVAEPAPSLADIAALVRALPEESQTQAPAETGRPARSPAGRSSETRSSVARTRGSGRSGAAAGETRAASATATERRSRQQAQLANPSRHWVQIAGGIDRAALPREFARLRAKAPEQLGRRSAYAAALRTTSRLLVGPFATAREAQEFVNQLARHDIQAFAWTSAAGQEIERLAGR